MSREEFVAEFARRKAAEAEQRARTEAAKAARPPAQESQEWVRQTNIAYAGLLVAALYIEAAEEEHAKRPGRLRRRVRLDLAPDEGPCPHALL